MLLPNRPRPLRSPRLRLLRLEDRLAPAAFTVNSLLDDGSGSGNSGTLRYCIAQANTNPGDDTIGFAVNGTIMLANGPLTLSDTTGQTTIHGPGADSLAIDAQMASRVFQINSSVNATIIGLTVTHGNSIGANGGGILSFGVLTVANCTISGNSATVHGGGIYGAGTITNCTISGNSASSGGGINTKSTGTLTVTNCTLTANSASDSGGGIFNFFSGIINLRNSTISGNSANRGGGMYDHSAFGLLDATNTIIAGNQAPVDPDLYTFGLTNLNNNLLDMSAAVAGLGTFGGYGGTTQTIPLLPGSPAIDAGTSNGTPTTDQRGFPRFGIMDIGAFEFQPTPVVVSTMVNDGSAQRSRVTSVTVTFNYVVSFASTAANSFTLTRNADGAPVGFTATAGLVGGVTVVTLNNFGGTATQFGSLADGRYTLTALASQIYANGQPLDGNGDGTPGDNYNFGDAQGLFRFFGDVNGDQVVNGLDFGFFKNAFGTQMGDANFLSYLDFNGDGVINGFDFGQFRTRFGTMLP